MLPHLTGQVYYKLTFIIMYEFIEKFNKLEEFFIKLKTKLIYDEFEIEKIKIQNLRWLILKSFSSVQHFNTQLDNFYIQLWKKHKLLNDNSRLHDI